MLYGLPWWVCPLVKLATSKALVQGNSIVLQPAQHGVIAPWRRCIPFTDSTKSAHP